MQITNPTTGQIITTVQEDNKESIEDKFSLLQQKRTEWINTPVSQKVEIIQKFHNLLESEIESLSFLLTQEMGKPLNESRNEINGAKERIKYFIEHSEQVLTPKQVRKSGQMTEKITYDPLGIIGSISAWNYPYLVGVNVLIPALIAGNSALYKPSEYSTLTGIQIIELLHQAGIPEGALQLVCGAKEAGKEILSLPLDGQFFTGSYGTGKFISSKVSEDLIPVGLELGGKDPLYITDAMENLDWAAQNTVEGLFYNNGQSCCAVERVYVHENIYDSFLEKFRLKLQKLVVGDPFQKETTNGPLTRNAHLDFLKNQREDAIKKGARLFFQGELPRLSGNFFPPTVLVDVNHQMKLMREETFGPLKGIMKVKNDQEAIQLMQDTSYGLTAAVFSQDLKRGQKILSQIDTGTSSLNCCDRVSPYLPWSGRKNSGLGVTLSEQGILAFTQPRAWQIRAI